MIPATPQAEEHTSHLRTQPFTHNGLHGHRGGRCAPPEAFWLQEDSQLTASSCSPLQAIKLRPRISQAAPGTDYNHGVGVPVLRWPRLSLPNPVSSPTPSSFTGLTAHPHNSLAQAPNVHASPRLGWTLDKVCNSVSLCSLPGKLKTTHYVVPKIPLGTITLVKALDLLWMPNKSYLMGSFISFCFVLNIYLLIWLHQVLAAACRILVPDS